MPSGFSPPNHDHWHYEYVTPDLLQATRVDRVLFKGKTAYQSVTIQDTACFGRTLVLDNKTQSAEVDEFIYHEALVHPCMVSHNQPTNIFIAGGGEGATAREVLSHKSVSRVVMVDIDREVVELCKEFLPNHHMGSFQDPRLELHHTDAFVFLQGSHEKYDVAIIDVPDPLEGGPAYLLYTREYYNLLKNRLRPRGMIVVQAGPTGPAFYEQCFSVVSKTIESVFPVVSIHEAFVPSFGATWGFIIGSMGTMPSSLSRKEIDHRITERVGRSLKYYDGTTHEGMFRIPKYLRKAIATETRIISTNTPLFVT